MDRKQIKNWLYECAREQVEKGRASRSKVSFCARPERN
jgi:hypothetical protein